MKEKYKFLFQNKRWQFVDTKRGKILYNFPDPVDDIFNGPEPCATIEDVKGIVEFELQWERERQPDGLLFNAKVPMSEMPGNTADIMAKALYDYYLA